MTRWHSASWWAGVSGLVGIAALVLGLMGYLRPPSGGGASAPAPTLTPSVAGLVARSPWLGIEVVQDERRVTMSRPRPRANGDDVHAVSRLALRSQPFELRFPRLPDGQGLHVAAWTDESIFAMEQGQPIESVPWFAPGTGMADTSAGSGDLVLSDEAHNYFVEGRIAPVDDTRQAALVSGVTVRFGAPLESPWGKVYVVVWKDSGSPTVDLDTVDFLELDFS